jgi:signal peptidase I
MMSKSKAVSGSAKNPAHSGQPSRVQAMRETVESIAVAVMLAFLFRAFVAEAFVIPTGSMAPTLMGQHKDVWCPECDFQYQAGASIEIDNRTRNSQGRLEGGGYGAPSVVVATTCPICRYRKVLDLFDSANEKTFAGDRILVSKFAYEFGDPERWDVIVFKYPFNAKQNFIKRLIGLPDETIRIHHGNIFIKKLGEDEFHIARKRDSKLLAMLQTVNDTKFIAKDLVKAQWPRRWQPWTDDSDSVEDLWTSDDQGHSYQTAGDGERDLWLRYHHIIPSKNDWDRIEQGEAPADLESRNGQLITDFYAYNAFTSVDRFCVDPDDYDPHRKPEDYAQPSFGSRGLQPYGTLGLHWVADLAMEGDVEVKGDHGELLMRLVKGGTSYICRIDVATGKATLSTDGASGCFVAADGQEAIQPIGETKLRGQGTYKIRYSNVDCELRLWVNDRRVQFDGPTTYAASATSRPVWTEEDPGDLAPLGIGCHDVALDIRRLRVLRDVYYVATQSNPIHEYEPSFAPQAILEILQDPTQWASTPLFSMRSEVTNSMGPDQFFPLGDNSPQSSDARLWEKPFFDRNLLIGKALMIYWPHTWNRPIPFLPNVKRMRLIR